jgi:site-specific DNA-adenine methylase
MCESFGLTYVGNKYNEVDEFEKFLPPRNNINKIVEVFGGAFGLTRRLYCDDKNILKIINDKSEEVFEYYKDLLDNNLSLLKKLLNKIIDMEDTKQIRKIIKDSEIPYKSMLIQTTLYRDIKKRTTKETIKRIEDLSVQMDNKYVFTHEDYSVLFRRFKNDNKAFIFLDPPYVDSYNVTYKVHQPTIKMYEDIRDLLDTSEAYVMLVINKNAFTTKLYKPWVVHTYDKLYQLNKTTAQHIVCVNY